MASGAPATSAGSSAKPPAASGAGGVEYEASELPEPELVTPTLPEQRAAMFRRMRALGVANDAQIATMQAILEKSRWGGQGHPTTTVHPMSRTECMDKRKAAGVRDEKKPLCGAPYMVPVYDPSTQTEADAKVCIDRYEFPGLPCEYPTTWISTASAQAMCKAIGKRLCDAHEWEGACAGQLRQPKDEYAFGLERKYMQGIHNTNRKINWAYGATKDHSKCAMGSSKSASCQRITWKGCGSNTYPAGAFPECKSSFGVYDQHGNAAEHMALPLKEKDLGARGGFGQPEMKGSWFIFQTKEAHLDDCRWRAPSWHDNEGKNHENYHLGFRCCKDVEN